MAEARKHKIWNPKMECMDRADMKKLQGERLKEVVKNVYENVPMYRERMDAMGVRRRVRVRALQKGGIRFEGILSGIRKKAVR